ncbi:ABC transporter ATP-binding protein [Actinomadura sp. 3N508]|uniref:ABC transporter ATP-binding protein n=1 Tax=Actinomadura sp. 3N508 TaxID=3375153 RepID=UPI0037B5A89B
MTPRTEPAKQLLAELPPAPAAWCSGLRKKYRRQTAVNDVSFTVGRGEVVGLLGPNGAGKTTVIKILLGLVRPDAGEVLLLGRPARDPRARARVGYLPELFRYQPWLTAAEVLRLHVRLAGTTVPDSERRECLSTVGLADRAEDRVGGFSKGMQQRLGLAVALVARPDLVVLDEPTSALDPLGRADVRDLLLSLRSRGVAVLLNSHLIGEVERVCDRVVILDKGRVATSGTLAELLGARELRLRLDNVTPEAEARLAATGRLTRTADEYTIELPTTHDPAQTARQGAGQGKGHDIEQDTGQGLATVPDLVADLVALGVRVHAVEPGRISLEERLLDILRTGPGEDRR